MNRDSSREVCVHVAGGEIAGQQVRSFLLSRGIPSRFRGESLRKVHGFTLNGLGEVRIYVPGEFETQARELMASVASGELELEEGEMVEASVDTTGETTGDLIVETIVEAKDSLGDARPKDAQPLVVVPPEGDDESD